MCVRCFCLYKSRTLGPLIDDLNLLATAINEKARRLIIPLAFFFIIYGNSHRAKWLITVTRIKIGKGDNRSTIKFNYKINTTLQQVASCRFSFFFFPPANSSFYCPNLGREATRGHVQRQILGQEHCVERNTHPFGTRRLSSIRSFNHYQQRMGSTIFRGYCWWYCRGKTHVHNGMAVIL